MDGLSHDRRTWMPIYAITIEATTTILLIIRLVSRFSRVGSRLGLDDACITISWAIASANIVLTVLATYRYGYDRHIWDVPPSLWEKGIEYAWLIIALFLWSTAFVKISVLLFYRRLVAGTYSKRFKWALWSAIAFIVLYTIILFFLHCFSCVPLEAQWRQFDLSYTERHYCASPKVQGAIAELGGALSVITDFYSVMLPAMLLLKIKITRRQRIGLMFVFALGFLVVIAGIVRTVFLSQDLGSNNIDKSWLGFNVFVAGIAESNVAIVCACAPSLKSLFRTYFRDRFTTQGSRSTSDRSELTSNTSTQMRSNTGLQKSKWGGKRVLSEESSVAGQDKPVVAEMYEREDQGQTPPVSATNRIGRGSPGPNLLPLLWLEQMGEGDDSESGRSQPPSFLYITTDEENDDEEELTRSQKERRT